MIVYSNGHKKRINFKNIICLVFKNLTITYMYFQDLSKVKVDIDQLRSLSSLGIDMEFLSEVEDELAAAQHDYGIAPALKHTNDLLVKLEKEQRDR